ncbi:MAG: hypothetical protein IPP74_12350 [Alphaproteobacteria bacterium]|nr:hypothetical protein [Alphaproteobacteria bacterium]
MSKLFYKAMIEDVQNNKCSEVEVENLLNFYEYAVKRMATTVARKSWFELRDFWNTKKNRINHFSLMIERVDILGQDQWWGTFEYNNKSLKVKATLEKN